MPAQLYFLLQWEGDVHLLIISLQGGRQALHFGQFKINIHKHGEEITPHAELAAPGTIDICIVCECDIQTTLNHLEVILLTTWYSEHH